MMPAQLMPHTAERSGIIAREPDHVARLCPRDLADGVTYLFRLAASIVRVVLDQAVHLPGWHTDTSRRGGEVRGRGVDECDLAPHRLGDRLRHLSVRHCSRPRDCVRLADVTRLGECGGSHCRNITDIDAAHPRVPDGP
jgi:hypothetical protein